MTPFSCPGRIGSGLANTQGNLFFLAFVSPELFSMLSGSPEILTYASVVWSGKMHNSKYSSSHDVRIGTHPCVSQQRPVDMGALELPRVTAQQTPSGSLCRTLHLPVRGRRDREARHTRLRTAPVPSREQVLPGHPKCGDGKDHQCMPHVSTNIGS